MIARADIIAEARAWIGAPYLHQASVRSVGCDCLGLVRGVWRALIGDEPERPPPYGADWALATQDDAFIAAARRHLIEIAPADARGGDVLLFRWRDHLPASHAGILSDDQHFIHAHHGACVAEISFTAWWRRHLVAAFSFPGLID